MYYCDYGYIFDGRPIWLYASPFRTVILPLYNRPIVSDNPCCIFTSSATRDVLLQAEVFRSHELRARHLSRCQKTTCGDQILVFNGYTGLIVWSITSTDDSSEYLLAVMGRPLHYKALSTLLLW